MLGPLSEPITAAAHSVPLLSPLVVADLDEAPHRSVTLTPSPTVLRSQRLSAPAERCQSRFPSVTRSRKQDGGVMLFIFYFF